MRTKLQLRDLTAKACYCAHEDGWAGKPVDNNTVERINDTIGVCPRALGGLNIGCAHNPMQGIRGVDWLFAVHMRGYEQKEVLQERYKLLNQLKLYLDQLTRINLGVNLDDLNNSDYIDDPRYAAAVQNLDIDDGLRKMFKKIHTISILEKTHLLHRIDDEITARMNDLLNEVRMITTNDGSQSPENTVYDNQNTHTYQLIQDPFGEVPDEEL